MKIEPTRKEKMEWAILNRGFFLGWAKKVVFEKGFGVSSRKYEIGIMYIGHYTMLNGYYRNRMIIGDHTWIGPQCFLHSAGGLRIGRAVGIGPKVTILTSQHRNIDREIPVYFSPLEFAEVRLGDGCDIGAGAVILPGAKIGEGAIVGAGAVVVSEIPSYEVWAGVPAQKINER
jgi:acetyltransferase-like isoleucine patch superfamily enzyme